MYEVELIFSNRNNLLVKFMRNDAAEISIITRKIFWFNCDLKWRADKTESWVLHDAVLSVDYTKLNRTLFIVPHWTWTFLSH